MPNTDHINVGDSVRTTKQLYFVEAHHPETGETIETKFPRWHRLIVASIDRKEDTITVHLPDGFLATLPSNNLEP